MKHRGDSVTALKAETDQTRCRYQRLSWIYDGLDWAFELKYRAWRADLWQSVEGKRVLEAGIGTGKNIPYFGLDHEVTGIDLTPGMLRLAARRARKHDSTVSLQLGDVQHLEFPNDSFDAAVATFVFCSVPDPVKGLSELRRVFKPGGTVYLLEHMRSPHETVGKIMDFLNPVTACLMGVHINRQTIENVEASGLKITSAHDIWAGGIYKRLTARVP